MLCRYIVRIRSSYDYEFTTPIRIKILQCVYAYRGVYIVYVFEHDHTASATVLEDYFSQIFISRYSVNLIFCFFHFGIRIKENKMLNNTAEIHITVVITAASITNGISITKRINSENFILAYSLELILLFLLQILHSGVIVRLSGRF